MQAIVHTPTNNLDDSISFYRSLNFEIVSASNPTLVRDGKTLIEINPERYARAGVKLFREEWRSTLAALESLTDITELAEGYLVCDPTGTWIYLIEGKLDLEIDGEGPKTSLGNYAGLSLETPRFQLALSLWQALGFKITAGTPNDAYVALATEEGFGVTVMKPLNCPHLFFNPSMTYFNAGKNLEVIRKIRDAKIPIVEEITHFNKEGIVDNVIIRDPGGYGFFIFND